MLNKIMDCFNLWRYGDNDGNWEDEDGFFGSVTEGDFLLNIVTYKPQTMDDVQETVSYTHLTLPTNREV